MLKAYWRYFEIGFCGNVGAWHSRATDADKSRLAEAEEGKETNQGCCFGGQHFSLCQL